MDTRSAVSRMSRVAASNLVPIAVEKRKGLMATVCVLSLVNMFYGHCVCVLSLVNMFYGHCLCFEPCKHVASEKLNISPKA